MPVGTTIAITAGAAALFYLGGIATGRATVDDQAVPLVEAQTAQLDTLTDGMADLVGRTQEPITLDAETRAALAQTPPQCVTVLGGNPLSLACAWATCLQYGQSSAQRPECRAVEAAYLADLPACVEVAP